MDFRTDVPLERLYGYCTDVPVERLYFATIVQTPSQELGGGVCW
jgi:hypothetical protein